MSIDVRALLLAEEVMHPANNPSYFVPLPACWEAVAQESR